MCGLVGLYQPGSGVRHRLDAAKALAAIAHRGPDGTGTFESPDLAFQAGFTRLAIIDLATGDQPLVDEGGARVFLGNGEIYNYREIRARLEAQGAVFKTQGDMEPAMRLFAAKGLDFVQDLNGMYGLAVWERDADRLVLVRDRLGVKPLYWAKLANGGILFASEIKALFASGLVEPVVDEASVTAYLAHGWVPGPATLWRGVSKLPAGALLVADAQGARVETYWRPRPAPGLVFKDGEEAKAALLDLLEDAVRLQLRSDVPVSAMLSGGLDSGLIVALAARNLDRPLATYTVRFQGAAVDESPLAARVASLHGTDHTRLDLDCDQAQALLPRLAWHADEPLADATLLPAYLINQLLAGRTRVVLNGTGGDELFAGYPRYFPTGLETRYLRLPKPARCALEAVLDRIDPFTAWRLRRAALIAADRGQYLHDHSTMFPPVLLEALGHRGRIGQAAQVSNFHEGDPQTAALMAELATYLPEDLLCLLDRTTMASSVEGRVPFLDHRLVEAALAVPPAIRTPGGRQKALERAMAEGLLPDDVLNAPKQGFASPVPAWFQGGLGKLAVRILTAPRTLDRGWWSKTGIERLAARPDRNAFRLYALLMLELTVRAHGDHRWQSAPTAGLDEMAGA
jgi:asparagine synthase (glutamine-hydrolysing)